MSKVSAVRAKVRLVEVTHTEGAGKKLKFETRYDAGIPEDMRFQKATPWGSFLMNVDNPTALEYFQLGREFYVDFMRVEEPPTA